MNRSAFLIAAVATAVLCVAAEAQTPDSLSRLLTRAGEQGWYLRVQTPLSIARGRAIGTSGNELRLVGSRVEVSSIVRVERRISELGGFFRGAALGGAALGFTGLIIGASHDPTDWIVSPWGLATLGAMFGAIGGGLVGLVTDPPSRSWYIVWSR